MFNTSKLTLAALCAFGGIALMPAAASAKIQNGLYSGTTSDGDQVNFTVITDPNDSSQQDVSGYGWNFHDTCKSLGTTLSGGWGTGFSTGGIAIASNNSVTLINVAPYLYVDMAIKIKPDGSATGKITTVDPTLSPSDGTTKPKKAVFCSSKPKSFTATLNVPEVAQRQVGTLPTKRFIMKQQ